MAWEWIIGGIALIILGTLLKKLAPPFRSRSGQLVRRENYDYREDNYRLKGGASDDDPAGIKKYLP